MEKSFTVKTVVLNKLDKHFLVDKVENFNKDGMFNVEVKDESVQLKDNEVYAPKYENGTKLALIRYPHAGTFEIPILTVNNKHEPAKKLLGNIADDAVGINKKVADRLSGADFDGDTVMCIPTHDRQGRVKIVSTPELPGLKGFDPQMAYPERPGMKYMKDPITGKDATQMEMGKISNLITDMTLFGAPPEDMAKAV